tara:strand:+ start:75 stop:602 length:528 start_codon:yes stop_codon:yes gene_type:complete
MSDTTLKAIIDTSKGAIHLRLFQDQAPLTVTSFVNLAQNGFYNSLVFHRVIDDFMAQGGCPLGTGTGNPGYQFEDECSADLTHDKPGILSMANSGPNTNGSQFFITHVPTDWLNGKHTVFGEIENSADMGTVLSIEQGDLINSISIEGDTSQLFETYKDRIEEWNQAIDASLSSE